MWRGPALWTGAALVFAVLLWIAPIAGLIGCLLLLAVAAPWGQTLNERAVISVIVLAGVVALTIPRASEIPVTTLSARLGLGIATLLIVGLRFIPRFRTPLPRVGLTDLFIAVVVVANALWMLGAYLFRSSAELVNALFFTGWDNVSHFIPFANTVTLGTTAWPTADGSLAWNQWYPNLHTTLWSLGHLVTSTDGGVDRVDLLGPYVVWTAVSCSLGLGVLMWAATELARRGASLLNLDQRTPAMVGAAVAAASFIVFGSPAWLFNFGFTSFAMGVAALLAGSLVATQSLRSALTLGWFVLPLSALIVTGIWTPLIIGLIPAGLFVLVALWRRSSLLAVVWGVSSAALIGTYFFQQSAAITAPEAGGQGDQLAGLASATAGMSPFNMGAAFAATVIAFVLASTAWRLRGRSLACTIAGPSLGVTALLVLATVGAARAEIAPLQSYYFVKVLDALLLINAPLLAAVAGIGFALARRAVRDRWGDRATGALVGGSILGVVLALSLYGYVGPVPERLQPRFQAAPGVAAGIERVEGTVAPYVGDAIVSAQEAARTDQSATPVLWDIPGPLVNIWIDALHGVTSVDQQRFYANLPSEPYGERTLAQIDLALRSNPQTSFTLLWFQPESEQLLATFAEQHPGRVSAQRVALASSPLCPSCSG